MVRKGKSQNSVCDLKAMLQAFQETPDSLWLPCRTDQIQGQSQASRFVVCKHCGAVLNADVNGAGNILIRVVPNPETKLIQGNVVS